MIPTDHMRVTATFENAHVQEDFIKKPVKARKQSQTKSCAFPDPETNPHYQTTAANLAAHETIGNHLGLDIRGDTSVNQILHDNFEKLKQYESLIDLKTDIDREVIAAQHMLVLRYVLPSTGAEACHDLQMTLSGLGGTEQEIANGYSNPLQLDSNFILGQFESTGWILNRDLPSDGVATSVIIKLTTTAFFGTIACHNGGDQRIYPLFAILRSRDHPHLFYIFCALHLPIPVRKLQNPGKWRSAGWLRNFPLGRDKDVTLNVLYLLVCQYLDPRYQTSGRFALIPHMIFHSVSVQPLPRGYNKLVPANYQGLPIQRRSELIFEIVVLDVECNTLISTDTPAFKTIFDNIFGNVRQKDRAEVGGTRCGLNIHNVTLELYETFEEISKNSPRLPSFDPPIVQCLHGIPPIMLSKDLIRLLALDDKNALLLQHIKVAYVMPDVPYARNSLGYRLAILWNVHPRPHLDFTPIANHYGLGANALVPRMYTLGGFEDLVKYKRMHETFANIGVFKPTVTKITDNTYASAAAAAVVSTMRGASSVGSEIVKAGSNQEIMRYVKKVDTLDQTVQQLAQTVHTLSDKLVAREAIDTTTEKKIDMVVRMNFTTQINVHVDRHERLQSQLNELHKRVEHRELTSEDRAAIQRCEARIQENKTVAMEMAMQMGVDITGKFLDF